MIISDEHRMVFLHIPKCAGTSARRYLADYDSTGGMFAGGIVLLEDGRQVDTAHIPLLILRDHFSEAFEKVRSYEAFVILRDPFQRFSASLFQRLRMYGEADIETLSPNDILMETREVIATLKSHGPEALLPHEFIHFQPQATYVELDGQRIIQNLFDMEKMAPFFEAINDLLGISGENSERLQGIKTNQSRILRSGSTSTLVSKVPTGLRYSLLGLVPSGLKAALRPLVFRPKGDLADNVMRHAEVTDFIKTFYARDIVLYRDACQPDLRPTSETAS